MKQHNFKPSLFRLLKSYSKCKKAIGRTRIYLLTIKYYGEDAQKMNKFYFIVGERLAKKFNPIY
jgi:hypothetical protein